MKKENEDLIKESVEEREFVLFSTKLITVKGGVTLQVLVDKPNGGITLDECSELSKELSLKLDVEDYFKSKYTLEVSSPGYNWPIKDDKSLNRVIGKKLKVAYRRDEKYTEVKGFLEKFDDEKIFLNCEKGSEEIKRDEIENIKLLLKFR